MRMALQVRARQSGPTAHWTMDPQSTNYGPLQVEKSKGGVAVSGEKGMEPPPALGRDGRQLPPVTKQGRVEVEMTSVPKTAVPSQTRQTQATTHATESPSHVDACLLSSSFPHLLLLSSDSLGLLKKSWISLGLSNGFLLICMLPCCCCFPRHGKN